MYSHTISPRLEYTCQLIFGEFLQLPYSLTADPEAFESCPSAKINYSTAVFQQPGWQMIPQGLLHETDIQKQVINIKSNNNFPYFFETNEDGSWDIFAATFYLVSRYEEYLPHAFDEYGRYPHGDSLAHKEGFLEMPLVNIWLLDFGKALSSRFPELKYQLPEFQFLPTYDIDIAYSFQHTRLSKTIRSLLFLPSLERMKIILGWKKDPFDVYDELDRFHETYGLQPIYFFLLAQRQGRYDKNILPHQPALRQLIKRHQEKYAVGLHPSWQSGNQRDLLRSEKRELEKIIGGNFSCIRSRQHYIRFHLPQGYQRLIDAGIKEDYSMGYGSINGYRASYANPFYWYDLEQEKVTSLRVFPFCYMEANSLYEQHLSAQDALQEMMAYAEKTREAHGLFISIWHNHMMGSDPLYAGWGAAYAEFLHHFCSRGRG